VTELDFELRFEVIREKKETGDKGKDVLGRPKGLRFDRDGCSSEIYSSNEKEILEWRNFLRGKINQRGKKKKTPSLPFSLFSFHKTLLYIFFFFKAKYR
jgi:hypothetical protein